LLLLFFGEITMSARWIRWPDNWG